MSSHVAHNYEDPSAPPRVCQNCRSPLKGPYCAHCGQHDIDYHRSFYHLSHDLAENLFHFEGKFFVTVAWLLAKPGRLTREFIAGRRHSQVNPLRLYIFVTVLFFLGVQFLNHGHLIDFDRRKADKITDKMKDGVKKYGSLTSELTSKQQEEVGRQIGEAFGKTQGQVDPKVINEIIERIRAEKKAADAAAAEGDAAKPKGPHTKLSIDESSNIGRALKDKFVSGELTFSKLIDEVEHRVPTLLFLGMPVFALLLKLLYVRRDRYYIEHLVFSVHLHTWVFLVFMVSLGYFKLAALGPGWLATLLTIAVVIWMPWYVLAAFRTVYEQSWRKTLVKIALLGFTYTFAIVVLAGLIIGGTVAWLAIA